MYQFIIKNKNSLKVIILICVPYALAISFVVSVGDQLQYYVLKLLNTQNPAIYESAHGQAIAKFPTLPEWLLNAISIKFLSIGIFVSFFTIKEKYIKKCALMPFFLIPIALMFFDLIGEFNSRTPSISSISINAVANISGGALAAAILATCFVIFVYSKKIDIGTPIIGQMIASLGVIGFGVFVSTAAFYLLEFLFHPTPQPIRAVVNSPAGFTASKGTATNLSEGSFIPKGAIGGRVKFTNTSSESTILWKKLDEFSTYEVKVYGLANCNSIGSAFVDKSLPLLTINDADTFSIDIDDGVSNIEIDKRDGASYSLKSQGVSSFKIQRTDQSIRIDQFVSPEDVFSAGYPDEITVGIFAPTFALRDKAVHQSNRSIRVGNGSRNITVTFTPTSTQDSDIKNLCDLKMDNIWVDDSRVEINGHLLSGGLILHIIRKSNAAVYAARRSQLSFQNVSGFLTVAEIDLHRVSDRSQVGYRFIQISGDFENQSFDVPKIAATINDQFVAIGELNVWYGRDGLTFLQGTANQLWKNGFRINQTKWEALPIEFKLVVLEVLLFLGGLLEVLRRILLRISKENIQSLKYTLKR